MRSVHLLSDCAGTFALHLPGHESANVRQNLGIYDKRPVTLNRRLKELCFWSLRLRNQRPYVTASARTHVNHESSLEKGQQPYPAEIWLSPRRLNTKHVRTIRCLHMARVSPPSQQWGCWTVRGGKYYLKFKWTQLTSTAWARDEGLREKAYWSCQKQILYHCGTSFLLLTICLVFLLYTAYSQIHA